jgi:hypothetical protein
MDFLGIGPIAELGKEILSMFPNAEQRAAAANKLQDFAAAVASKQSDINIAEAASGNWFASSWRPACGWLCTFALAYNAVVAPMFHLGIGDTSTLVSILTGMLGLGTLRTAEKISASRK